MMTELMPAALTAFATHVPEVDDWDIEIATLVSAATAEDATAYAAPVGSIGAVIALAAAMPATETTVAGNWRSRHGRLCRPNNERRTKRAEGNALFFSQPNFTLRERKKLQHGRQYPKRRSDVQIVPVARQLASQEIVSC